MTTVGPVVEILRDSMLALAITVVVHDRANRTVDRELLPVDTEPRELRVEVGEVATSEERVVAEANPRDDV